MEGSLRDDPGLQKGKCFGDGATNISGTSAPFPIAGEEMILEIKEEQEEQDHHQQQHKEK